MVGRGGSWLVNTFRACWVVVDRGGSWSVKSFPTADEPVFAAWRTPAGRWSIVASCCRDLSGRTGVRRIAVLDEPAATAGGAKVIKLKEHAGVDRRA